MLGKQTKASGREKKYGSLADVGSAATRKNIKKDREKKNIQQNWRLEDGINNVLPKHQPVWSYVVKVPSCRQTADRQ